MSKSTDEGPASDGWVELASNEFPVDGTRLAQIYFKVFDPQFFVDHQGHSLRFFLNGTEFIDTGLKLGLPKPHGQEAATDVPMLPLQAEALK